MRHVFSYTSAFGLFVFEALRRLVLAFLSASTLEWMKRLNPLISNSQLLLQRRQLFTFSMFFLKFEIRPLSLSHYIPPVLFNRPDFCTIISFHHDMLIQKFVGLSSSADDSNRRSFLPCSC